VVENMEVFLAIMHHQLVMEVIKVKVNMEIIVIKIINKVQNHTNNLHTEVFQMRKRKLSKKANKVNKVNGTVNLIEKRKIVGKIAQTKVKIKEKRKSQAWIKIYLEEYGKIKMGKMMIAKRNKFNKRKRKK